MLKSTHGAFGLYRLEAARTVVTDTAGRVAFLGQILLDAFLYSLVEPHTRRVLGPQVDQVSLQAQRFTFTLTAVPAKDQDTCTLNVTTYMSNYNITKMSHFLILLLT